jgi:hypothetical protein
MTEEEILRFVSATVKSIWALELLLAVRRQRPRAWRTEELVAELRASIVVVREALAGLGAAGLIACDDTGHFCYRPISDQLDAIVESTQGLYSSKPLAIINAIAAAPNEKLRIFADAFRLKE